MKKYKITLTACLLGIFTQAVACNLIALLFVPFMTLYGLTFVHLGILVALNFGIQIAVDLTFAPLIDKIGYKRLVLPACALACTGLAILGAVPLFKEGVFIILLVATAIFSASCGLLEILLSPMVTAMDSDHGKYMSLLHSAYAWGQVLAIMITTGLLAVIDITSWYIIPLLWAILPLVCFFMFLNAPYPKAIDEEKREKASGIMRNPTYLLLLAVMFLGAASEVTMNQFASTFAEKALGLDKATGDLLCMCGFAAMLGIGRTLQTIFGHKLNLNKVLIISASCSFVCYIAAALCPIPAVSVAACALCGLCTALLWPGSAIVATRSFPLAGSWLYASLAVLGDSGAALIPFVTGSLADAFQGDTATGFSELIGVSASEGGLRLALLCVSVCPLICAGCHYLLYKRQNSVKKP